MLLCLSEEDNGSEMFNRKIAKGIEKSVLDSRATLTLWMQFQNEIVSTYRPL